MTTALLLAAFALGALTPYAFLYEAAAALAWMIATRQTKEERTI